MKLNDKRNEIVHVRVSPIQSHPENPSANDKPSHEEIRLRAYEIYLFSVAACQAMSLMIGCKPNANLSVRHHQKRRNCPSRERLNETS